MEEAAKPKEANKIQTFVFFDLESTGVYGNSTRIVELSMIAVSRTHLLEMKDSATVDSMPPDAGEQPSSSHTTSSNSECTDLHRKNAVPKLPRVMHKYTRLYYPWTLMPPRAEKVNGLSNEALEHLPSFTEASAQALVLFLDLPKPISLVAHNGNKFDFPLLMAELTKVGCVDKFLDLQCTDSLCAIKDIDALIEREDITEITKLAESFSIDDLDDELLCEEFNPSKRPRSLQPDERDNQAPHSSSRPHEPTSHTGRGNQPTMEVSAQPLLTPVKSHPPGLTSIPATPSKPAHPPTQHTTPEASQPGTPGTSSFCARVTKESSKVRRTLVYDNDSKRKFGGKLSYSQPNIYRRLFDSEYNAHRAESDCEALLTICGHYGSKFVEWADTFATSFLDAKPMWVKRKSFNTN